MHQAENLSSGGGRQQRPADTEDMVVGGSGGPSWQSRAFVGGPCAGDCPPCQGPPSPSAGHRVENERGWGWLWCEGADVWAP